MKKLLLSCLLGGVMSLAAAAAMADQHEGDDEVTFDPEDACVIAMPANCDNWCTNAPAAANYETKDACMKVCKSNAALCRSQGMPGY